MWIRQTVICASIIVLAVMLQLTLLSRLGLPGATPDLVVVCVVALALAYGPVTGAVVGFAAGLVLGFSPPAGGIIGIQALIFLVIGFLTGAVIDPRDRTVPVLMGMVGLSTGAAALAYALLLAAFGGNQVLWDSVPALVLTSSLYGLILAPAVVPGVAWLVQKVTPEIAV
ncbi:MAG: rod shape-determining protein MreD [Candidatus Nanopelagicales bacterium]|nr:rod shape-determining protein MreD [Candidatus Nanopelagicales bacterium]